MSVMNYQQKHNILYGHPYDRVEIKLKGGKKTSLCRVCRTTRRHGRLHVEAMSRFWAAKLAQLDAEELIVALTVPSTTDETVDPDEIEP